jgi:glycosyltransferase involved in cell wall biosynthesis
VTAPPALALVVRNGSHRLEPLVEGLLAQDPRPTISVLDDHSTDATGHVLDQFARTHGEVRVRRTEARVGLVEAFRRAAALVRELRPDADLFAWVCGDDKPDPDWLGPLVRALRRRDERVAALPAGPGRPLVIRDVADPARRAAFALAHRWPPLPTGIVIRLDALPTAGGVRSVGAPAAVLGAELALAGELVTIDHCRYERGPWIAGGLTEAYPNGIPTAALLPPRVAALATLSRHHGVGGAVLARELRDVMAAGRRRAGGWRPGTAPSPAPGRLPSPGR